MVITCLPPQHPLELGVVKRKQELSSCPKLSYLSICLVVICYLIAASLVIARILNDFAIIFLLELRSKIQ